MRDAPLVLVTEALSDAATQWLAERCRVERVSPQEPAWAELAARAEGLVVRTYTTVDEALLKTLPRLRVVGRAGVGLDAIDLPACRRRGVPVVSTPDANTQAVVEYVLCLLCDALRPRLYLEHPLPAEEWTQLREEVVGLWQMDELRLGILGMGRIGRRVAAVAGAIGFECVYNDLAEVPESARSGARPVPVEELFAESDVLTLHVDGRPSNRHFVSAPLLQLMRPDVLLLNTCRGMVLDAAALAEFLRANPAASAILDVHCPEPFTEASPLVGLPNAHLAPHLAARTMRAMDNMSWVVRDVWAVLDGRPPVHPAPADGTP